jgi:CHASE2 domain-containing sensor protein/nitrogen-specific signal transduction histidine kinase
MAVAAGLSLLMVAITLSGAADRADNLFYDWSTGVASHDPPDDIVVVAIDDESLSALGPWPWPRAIHAAMLRRLASDHPLAVIYDVLYLGASSRPEDDTALGRAFAAIPHAFAPMLFKTPGDNGRGYDPLWPIGPVRANATIGHALVQPDRDGVVRRLDLAVDGEQRWTHVAALAAALRPAGRALLQTLPRFRPRPPRAPLRRQGDLLVGFGGPPGHVRTASFVSVLRGEIPPSLLEGRYVLVGATAPGLGDQFSTPVGGDAGLMSGIEIQANFLNTLLTGPPIREASTRLRLELGLPALWLLMIGFLRLPPNSAGVLGVALMIAVAATSAALLFLGHLWAPPVAILIVLGIAQPLWTWRRLSVVSGYMIEELSRLAADPDLATAAPRRALIAQDHVANQVDLMRETVERVRGLRRLIGAAVRSLPDPTVLVSLDGEITLANAEAQRLFGGRARPEPADIERFFAASKPPPFTPELFGDPARPWVGERAGADGSLREILHVPWTDESGVPLGWVVRFADITAMRRAETAREEALQLLTHDMRSPQASILALVAEDSATPHELRARVAHYAKRTLALADGFLRLARADAGNYEREPTDIADVMTEATDDLWVLASSRGVRIVFDGGDGEYMALGNRALLIRAFTNILDNAVKFSPPGSTIDCTIESRVAAGRSEIVCAIADHGAGMSPEVVGKLFQRFSHHASGRAGPVDGVGLGLAFVQSVFKGHGGSIACRSQVGVGTTFEIVLPALAVSSHGVQAHEDQEQHQDDDAHDRGERQQNHAK